MDGTTMRTTPASVGRLDPLDWTEDRGQAAFERFYRHITNRDDLPTIPEVAHHLTMAVNRPDTTAANLAALIARDQSLAAKLLRLANSAFFGLRQPVTDLHRAVTLLGFGTVRDLVMTLTLWGTLGDSDPTISERRRDLWVHCATVAAAAKLLAKQLGGVDAGEALSAGLLHDIGKLLLGLRLGATYWEMLDQAEDTGENPTLLEREVFGVHHGTVGQYMLQIWALPPALCAAISDHHEPLGPASRIRVAQVVNAANRLVHLIGAQSEEEAGGVLEALAPGGLTVNTWRGLRAELEAEQEQIGGFFADA